MIFKTLAIVLSLFCFAFAAQAADHLLYFEAQGVGMWSSEKKKTVFYSQNPDAEMQKPGVGFDYLQKLSGESGDWGSIALQGRLALSEDLDSNENGNAYKVEPQIYNAYLKVKTPVTYVWVGHNRPAFGLSSYFDSHALILRTLAIQGFGYDRDWGAGLYRDFSWGDVAATATTGSGMPILFKGGNYMTAARVSYGVLSRDNYNLGVSGGYGYTLDTMGYKLMDPEPQLMRMGAVDFTYLRNSFEHRFDVYAGTWLGKDMHALFYRLGWNIDREARFKLEGQPVFWKLGDDRNYQLSVCLSVAVTSTFTVRLGYTYDHAADDNQVVLQLYFYRPI